MTHKPWGILFVLGALRIAAPLFGDEGNPKVVQATSTQKVPFQPGGTIHLNRSYGHLSIEGWDQPEVQVIVTRSLNRLAGAKEQAEAAKRLEKVGVAVERRSDTGLEITTTVPHYSRWTHPLGSTGGVMLEYRILVPRDSRLVIQHGTGDVVVTGVTSDIEVRGHAGDIVLLLPESGAYAIDAKSKIGTVWSDFDGDFQKKHLTGIQYAHAGAAGSHRIYLRMGVGGITIKGSPPAAQPPTAPAVQ
jgi:hypothetical protein